MTMKKTYVLDTNVLIQAPYALECFEDNRIVLPLAVLEELDSLKSAEGEAGRNARQTIRYLESLRLQGNLLEGVTLQNGGSLRRMTGILCNSTIQKEGIGSAECYGRLPAWNASV